MDKDEWSKVKEFVKINIGESAHTNWIQPIELKEIKGTVAKFKVPTRFIGTWVHRNYGDHIIQGFKNQKISINRLEFISSSDKRSNKKNGSEKSVQKKYSGKESIVGFSILFLTELSGSKYLHLACIKCYREWL